MTSERTGIDLSAFIKAYDVRGLVGSQLPDDVVAALAAGFVDEVQAAGIDVIVGHDMRDSSPQFADAFARVHEVGMCMETHPTYFETVTAMAFLLFRDANIDLAVVEVGLGGRLDATNVVNPVLSAITPVDS